MSSGFLPRRTKEKTLLSESLASSHSKPCQSKSTWCRAGSDGEHLVQVAHQGLHTTVRFVLQQVPVEAASLAPFLALGNLLSHEQQFFSGMRELIAEKQTQIGELLPHVAGHFVKKRVLAVDDFVVREGQDEIFGEGVKKREGQLVVLVAPEDRILGKIV